MANRTDTEDVSLDVGGRSFVITAPKGLSNDEVVRKAIIADPEFRTAYLSTNHGEKQAAASAGVSSPGYAPPPLKPEMERKGAQHIANEETLHREQWRAGRSPTPVTNAASVLYPAAGLAEAASQGVLPAAKAAGRGLVNVAKKSVAGGLVGAGAGYEIGGKRGAEVGAVAGAAAGNFLPNRVYANLPSAISHFFLSDADYAEIKAAQKVAQLEADTKAGLRAAPDAIDYEKNARLNRAAVTRGSGKAYDPLSEAASGSRGTGPAARRGGPPAPPSGGAASASGSGARPVESEQLATWLNKQDVWTPEMERAATRAWGPKARMQPGEGMVNYRARIQGYGYAARSSTGMPDVSSGPTIKP